MRYAISSRVILITSNHKTVQKALCTDQDRVPSVPRDYLLVLLRSYEQYIVQFITVFKVASWSFNTASQTSDEMKQEDTPVLFLSSITKTTTYKLFRHLPSPKCP